MVAEFMVDRLSGWGLQVTARADPLSALETLQSERDLIDLVITDQTMPRLTGLELAARIRASYPDLPVVLYSGFGDGLTDEAIRDAGVLAFLKKPVEAGALFAVLQRCLAAQGESKESRSTQG